MKIVLLFIFTLLGFLASAQTKRPQSFDLPSHRNILETFGQKNAAIFALSLANVEGKPYSPAEITQRFEKVVSETRPQGENILYPCYPYYLKYKANISEYLKGTLIYGGVPVKYYISEANLPVYFSEKNGLLNLTISGLAYDKVLNIYSANTKKRASTVAASMLTAGISKLEPLLSIPSLSSISVSAIYACEDFSKSRSAFSFIDKIEIVTMSAPVSLYRQYISGAITENTFIKRAEFYIREAGVSDNIIKRIEINLPE